MAILIVTPNDRWTEWLSANLRGSPATHAVDSEISTARTLCGRNPDRWMWQNWGSETDLKYVNCKICLRRLGRDGK